MQRAHFTGGYSCWFRWSGLGSDDSLGTAAPTLAYFALLGLAFIAVELVFVQMLMKLIGYPLYAVTTVVTVMLFGAWLGSMASRRVAGVDGERGHLAFASIVAIGVTVCTLYEPLATHFLASAMAVRVAVAAAMIFPLAFFMGMPFPLGMQALESKPQGVIAWAWSMNGLFTTVGSVATAVSSLCIGFRIRLWRRSPCTRSRG